jgi:hypothetical protein
LSRTAAGDHGSCIKETAEHAHRSRGYWGFVFNARLVQALRITSIAGVKNDGVSSHDTKSLYLPTAHVFLLCGRGECDGSSMKQVLLWNIIYCFIAYTCYRELYFSEIIAGRGVAPQKFENQQYRPPPCHKALKFYIR